MLRKKRFMALKLPFSYDTVPSIRFGVGSLTQSTSDIIAALGKRIMIVTDSGLVKLGVHLSLLNEIEVEVEDVSLTIFDEVESDPSSSTVFKAIAHATRNSVTGIIGFGGGSSMDVAKLAALICGSKEKLNEAWGVANAKGPRLPLCLIPTTAGTGS